MKFISLLIALLIVGFLIKKQLNPSPTNAELKDAFSSENVTIPNVPTHPNDVQKFEHDINEFMLDSADGRASEINKSLNNE